MSQTLSRRELGKKGLLGLAAVSCPSLLAAQQTNPSEKVIPGPTVDEKLAGIEAKLAKPLSEEAKSLTKTAIGASEAQAASRLPHKLRDCSEPCTILVPQGIGRGAE